MHYLALISLFVLAANAKLTFNVEFSISAELDYEWEQWKIEHSREYESDIEEEVRRRIFEDNLVYIQTMNSQKLSYTLGLNQFSDLTNKEYRDISLGYDYEQSLNRKKGALYEPDYSVELPASMDWRMEGAVTPVKNQEQCGSCWSFSATGSLEGQYFLMNKTLKSFSEQQLVDCSTKYGNHGCKGGLMDNAFEYWEEYLDELETDYPYTARDGRCRYDSNKGVQGDSSYKDIPRESTYRDESGRTISGLMSAVADVGPISVAMDASHRSFQSYKGGVYTERKCSSTRLDHGVLVVGYGTEDMTDFWLVKNSWGTVWGMEGYFKISQAGNMCGLETQASYPVL